MTQRKPRFNRGDVVEYNNTNKNYATLCGHVGVVTGPCVKTQPGVGKTPAIRFYPVQWITAYYATLEKIDPRYRGQGSSAWSEHILRKIGHIDLDAK